MAQPQPAAAAPARSKPRRLGFDEVSLATGHFDPSRVVGAGGFGKVYLGTPLPSLSVAGTPTPSTAVKVLSADSQQGHAELVAEIQVLSICTHTHLLALLGVCLDVRAVALVYPLMAGGSLADRLGLCDDSSVTSPTDEQRMRLLAKVARMAASPGTSGGSGGGGGGRAVPSAAGAADAEASVAACACGGLDVLGWRQRVYVVRDAMRGLAYLHTPSGSKGVVLHRDIKPTNILLDSDGVARLGDFGLAKHACELSTSGRTHLSTRHLVGTPGYIDPLYADTGRYDQRTDNYAMGISLLVALTGRAALQAKEEAADLLDDPSRATRSGAAGAWPPPTAGAATAGSAGVALPDWPLEVVEQLARLVVGLSWERTARRRMSTEAALARLEEVAQAAAARQTMT